jgi:hypothetical protein
MYECKHAYTHDGCPPWGDSVPIVFQRRQGRLHCLFNKWVHHSSLEGHKFGVYKLHHGRTRPRRRNPPCSVFSLWLHSSNCHVVPRRGCNNHDSPFYELESMTNKTRYIVFPDFVVTCFAMSPDSKMLVIGEYSLCPKISRMSLLRS